MTQLAVAGSLAVACVVRIAAPTPEMLLLRAAVNARAPGRVVARESDKVWGMDGEG